MKIPMVVKPIGALVESTGSSRSPSKLSVPELLTAGGIAGSLAKSVIAPMDRVKILIQTNPNQPFSVCSAYRIGGDIVRKGGVSALWKGHLATIIRVMPYSATNFMVFSRTGDLFDKAFPSINHSVLRFTAGAVSGSVATAITYPLETMRARLAVDQTGQYRSGYISAVREIAAKEGLLTLYSGLKPTLYGIVPYAGISFATYDFLKQRKVNRLLSGAISGVIAQSCTYPLDVVRRRMQVNPGAYSSMRVAFVSIARTEGVVKGLYKGLSMNWFKGPVAVAISLTTNDVIQEWLTVKYH